MFGTVFVRLREVSVRYRTPMAHHQSLLKNIGLPARCLSAIRVFGSGHASFPVQFCIRLDPGPWYG